MFDSVPAAPWWYNLRSNKTRVSLVKQEVGRSFLSRCSFYWRGGTLSGLCSNPVPFVSTFCRMSEDDDRWGWDGGKPVQSHSKSRLKQRHSHREHGHHSRDSRREAEGAAVTYTSSCGAGFKGGAVSQGRGRETHLEGQDLQVLWNAGCCILHSAVNLPCRLVLPRTFSGSFVTSTVGEASHLGRRCSGQHCSSRRLVGTGFLHQLDQSDSD